MFIEQTWLNFGSKTWTRMILGSQNDIFFTWLVFLHLSKQWKSMEKVFWLCTSASEKSLLEWKESEILNYIISRLESKKIHADLLAKSILHWLINISALELFIIRYSNSRWESLAIVAKGIRWKRKWIFLPFCHFQELEVWTFLWVPEITHSDSNKSHISSSSFYLNSKKIATETEQIFPLKAINFPMAK